MLRAKTREQQAFIESLAEKESCDGDVIVDEDGITYKIDSFYYVGISFDIMAKVVDYLRNENKE